MRKGEMSIAVIVVLAVVVIVAIVGAILLRPKPAPPPPAPTPIPEFIAGLKRWPGTWEVPTIKIFAREAEVMTPAVTVDIRARRAEFDPAEVRVKRGQVVKLRITGEDSGLADMPEVDPVIGLREFSGHGFQILGPYDVWLTGIRKDVTKEVVFKADVPGEFQFQCTVFCSPDHYLMYGKLIVE